MAKATVNKPNKRRRKNLLTTLPGIAVSVCRHIMSPAYLSDTQKVLGIFTTFSGQSPSGSRGTAHRPYPYSPASKKLLYITILQLGPYCTKTSDRNPLNRTWRNYCFSRSNIDAKPKDITRPARASKLKWKSHFADLINSVVLSKQKEILQFY